MSGVIVYERFTWFHNQVKAERYPNTRHLSERFEISRRTAKRNIEFMKDRLEAPLEYDHAHRGYFYGDDAFELPHLPVTPEEVLAVLIARRLLSDTAGGFISNAMRRFGRKLLNHAAGFGLEAQRLDQIFSATWHGFSPVPPDIFHVITRSLLEQKLIEFTYHSPLSESTTRRTVEPHHLQHYMASWVLIARCRLRNQWRKFYLARMSDWKLLDDIFKSRPLEEWQSQLEGAFGIFQGGACLPVTLRFNPFRAKWIRGQQWHPEQSFQETPGGGVDLCFPVADFREVKMMILQFGADVEVIAPDALRLEVAEEIRKMDKI